MSLSGLTDAHRAYLLRHLRPLEHVDLRAGEVRNKHLHRVHGLFTAQSTGTRTGAQRAKQSEASLPMRSSPSSATPATSSRVSEHRLASSVDLRLPQTCSIGLSSGA